MQFVFLSEGDTRPGATHYHRYQELVEEVKWAERWGFDAFGVSEQHLAVGAATTSSPEVLYGFLYPQTSRIRFRHAVSLIPVNHPLKIAANVAVADILSNGRIEVGLGRGNTTLALRAFEVDLERSRLAHREGIEIIKKAFTEDPFMYYGEYYKIPPRSLVPKGLQKPYPPLFVATSGEASHVTAGETGLGVMSVSSAMGFELLTNNLNAYVKAVDKTAATGEHVNKSIGVLVNAYCAETDEIAREEGGELNMEYVRVAYSAYTRLAKMSESYKYMGDFAKVQDRLYDYDWFINESAIAVIGSPDSCIKQIERYRESGATEMILRIDSLDHAKIMKAIEMFGRHVIPQFKHPENIVRSAEEVLGDIRKMREVAKQQGVYVELDTKEGAGKKEGASAAQ